MRARFGAAIAVVVVLALGAPAPVSAHRTEDRERVRQQELNRQIADLEDEIGALSAEEHDLAHRLAGARSRRIELDTQLTGLEREIAAVAADLTAATERMAAAEDEVAVAKRQLGLARARLRDARSDLRERAVAAYVSSPSAEIADAVFDAEDLRELGARTAYARAVVATHVGVVDRMQAARDDAVAAGANHQAALARAVEARDTIAVQRAELEERRHAQAEVRGTALSHEREEQRLLAHVQRQKDAHERELSDLRAESESIASFLRSIQAGQAVTVSGDGQLSVPISGARLSSRFGPRVHPIFGTQRLHSGVDWAAPSGTPVRSAAAGRVVHAGWRGGYGNAVIVDHGGSLATLYAHLSVITVASGAQVGRGQVIGAVGSTGFSTGPHLHFEVRVAGSPVDPLPYL